MDPSEIFDSATEMGSDLEQGLQTIALKQKVSFKLYGRIVLPIDGWVFWVRMNLLKRSMFKPYVTAQQIDLDDMGPTELDAKCSLHYLSDFRQEETENYVASRIIFTTDEEIREFTDVAPQTMWIGTFGDLKFGFSSASKRYVQAGIWHYSGFALFADMQQQVIDDVGQFSADQVVSNSLPAWLALQAYRPLWATWQALPPMFPSFLVPDNEPPPFMSVHVVPESTAALASVPTIDPKSSTSTQLCSDQVRITLWGVRNNLAIDFVNAVNQYSLDTGAIGVMNMPVIRDDKRTQAEMRTIAQKKVIDFTVSYLQHRMNNIGKQIIRTAIPTLYVTPGIKISGP